MKCKSLFLLVSLPLLINFKSCAQKTSIPEDVSYSIIKEDIVLGIKRGLDVRLNKKVSKDVLREIAIVLKESDSRTYERTLIGYILPNMKLGEGAWATTHFNPYLEVKILGLSKEEEIELTSQNKNEHAGTIGRWLEEGYLSSRLVLIREEEHLFMQQTFKDGSNRKMKVVEKQSPFGRRIERVENSLGDFWVINNKGDLEIRDAEGIINVAKKIR